MPGEGPLDIGQHHSSLAAVVDPEIDIFDRPARRTTSHSVICSEIPPAASGAARARGLSRRSPRPARPPAHCPSGPTRSAAVIGRSSKSFLPPEKVAQSGLRMSDSGLGASVTLFRLRSDEQAPIDRDQRREHTMRRAIRSIVASPDSAFNPHSSAAGFAFLRRRDSDRDHQATPRNRKYIARKAGRLAAGPLARP